MIWYLLNIAIITIAYLLPARENLSDIGQDVGPVKRKRVCVVGTITWILLSGLRHISVGADTLQYKYYFDAIQKTSWSSIFERLYDRYINGADIKDPGYPIFEKICNIFTDNYTVYLIIIATIFFVSMGLFIHKFSENPYLSYILFSTLFYSFFAITGHRQTIATAVVVLLGTFLIKKKKFIPFLIIILLMSTIHRSCLCFIPFYFISKIKINKITLLIYWFATISAFVFRYELLDLLQSILGYEMYQDYEGAGAGTFLYLLLAFGILVTFFCRKLLENDTGIIRISINALMLACFFSPLLLINQSTMRLIQYFSLFLLLLLPKFGKILSKRTDRTVYNMIVTLVLVVLFAMTNPTYRFFWQ
ncbi:MAG: EpsG family protein [Clostridia bacterium]|nr:EpsG family protein [Clostridia bacterium]